MKLLLFSDLHCDVAAAERLVERSRSVDVLVGAGDFGTCRRHVAVCLDVLRAADRPAVFVPGNNESLDELVTACRSWREAHVLHGTGATVQEVAFFGLGGGVPVTPFGAWSYDFTEEQAAEMLQDCPRACVLVSHSPPKGAVDVASNGKSLGSVAVRAAIERTKPKLVVCGHIHGSSGQQVQLGSTAVINAGPEGVEWTLSG